MDVGGGGGGGRRPERDVKVRVQIAGVRYYLGRAPSREAAQRAQESARDEYLRTGHIKAVSLSHRGVGTLRNDGGNRLWYWSHFEAGREREFSFEEKIMAGVTRDAVVEGLSSDDPSRRAEAVRWIRSDARHLYAFVTICDYFGIDVDASREALLEEGGHDGDR